MNYPKFKITVEVNFPYTGPNDEERFGYREIYSQKVDFLPLEEVIAVVNNLPQRPDKPKTETIK